MVVRELKKQIIKSKVEGDLDHVNHYFLKKHLHAMTKMKNDQCAKKPWA